MKNSNLILFCFLVCPGLILQNCQQRPHNQEKEQTAKFLTPPPGDGPPGMVWIPGGTYQMGGVEGDQEARPDEYPAHPVTVDGFWMDQTEVTNEQFREFVNATGYVTTAEKKPDWEELKKQLPPNTPKPHDSLLVPASMVFTPVKTQDLYDWSQWWRWVPGATWKNPQGANSTIEGKNNFPVVQVSWFDAVAYLTWAGKRLPTESEWEFAARGGKENQRFAWNENENITLCANTWQGKFPEINTGEDGYVGLAPIQSYKPNEYGLYDMAGNAWEWTNDWYHAYYYADCQQKGLLVNPEGPAESYDPLQPTMAQKSMRGGSFLCNATYCSSYRVSARMHSTPDSGQDHVGFRGIMTLEMWKQFQKRQIH